MGYVFSPSDLPSLPVLGTQKRFLPSRVFCVGRNYADHAREMGAQIDKTAPFYFMKSAQHIALSGGVMPYAAGTQNLHYEMELVVAIGKAGFCIDKSSAYEHVYGYACGLDMTRRDLQTRAKEKGLPWDSAKNFANSAIISPLCLEGKIVDRDTGKAHGRIALSHNGECKQEADLSQMLWTIDALIADLSQYYHLQVGDLLFTGTPAGVGAVQVGDVLAGEIENVGTIALTIGAPL